MAIYRNGQLHGGGGGGRGAIPVAMLPGILTVQQGDLYLREGDRSLWTRDFTVIPARAATDAIITSNDFSTHVLGTLSWSGVNTAPPYPEAVAAAYFNPDTREVFQKAAGSLAGTITTGAPTYDSTYNFRGVFATEPTGTHADDDIYFNSGNGNWYIFSGTAYTVVADPATLFDETNAVWLVPPLDTQAEVLGFFYTSYVANRTYIFYDSTAGAIVEVTGYTPTTTDWTLSDFNSVSDLTGTTLFFESEAEVFTEIETNGYVAATNYLFLNAARNDLRVLATFTDAMPFMPEREDAFWAPVSQDLVRGPAPNQFADDAARDAALTGAALTPYENNELLLIGVDTQIQRYVNSAWQQVTGWAAGERGVQGERGDESRYVVSDANNTQTGSAHVLTITGYTTYGFGDQIVFKVQNLVNPANQTVQINSLTPVKLLKNGGEEFRTAELGQGTQITATFDGTNFISDFKDEPQYHTVIAGNITVSADGNGYVITDNAIKGFGVTPPQLLYLEAEADNTGDVTLSINGSTAQPVQLADGSAIPSGFLKNGQPMLIVWASGAWRITNLQPSRSLRGALLATCDIAVGTHPEGTVFPWSVESGISYLSTATLPANYIRGNAETANGVVLVPLTRGDRTSQLGWYIEITNGTTVVFEKWYEFNEYSSSIQREVTTTDGLKVSITHWQSFPAISPMHMFVVAIYNLTNTDEVVAAGNTYQVRLHLSEN